VSGRWRACLVAGDDGFTSYQATVGGLADPFAPPGTVPADPAQAQVLILVQNGRYDTALDGVKRAIGGYQGAAKMAVGQAQNSSDASSSQIQVDVRASDPSTLRRGPRTLLTPWRGPRFRPLEWCRSPRWRRFSW
jgi:hypothetical protein